MPELPDLQVFSHNLQRKLSGKKLARIEIPVTKKLKASTASFKKALETQAVKKVWREGKELRFRFSNGNILGLHLMLHGELKWFETTNEHKSTVAEMTFTDGTGLAITDWQKNATLTLNPEERESPDALSGDVDFTFLKDQLQRRKTSIKNVLLDQDVIRGVGNAYADEILWDAGISPFSSSNKIPDNKIRQLLKSMKKILKNAEKQILKSHPDLVTGEVRDFLAIHNSKKDKSPKGGKILSKVIGGRKTYYTEEQEEYI